MNKGVAILSAASLAATFALLPIVLPQVHNDPIAGTVEPFLYKRSGKQVHQFFRFA